MFVAKTIGVKRAAEVMMSMGYAAEDAIPFWEGEVLPDMERIEYQVFKSQGRRGGGSWQFLSPETIATKVRKGESPLINIATGTLLTSVSEGAGFGNDAPYSIREVTPTMLRFGSSAPGAKQSQKHRPFLRWTQFDAARWARWWARYVIRMGQAANVSPDE